MVTWGFRGSINLLESRTPVPSRYIGQGSGRVGTRNCRRVGSSFMGRRVRGGPSVSPRGGRLQSSTLKAGDRHGEPESRLECPACLESSETPRQIPVDYMTLLNLTNKQLRRAIVKRYTWKCPKTLNPGVAISHNSRVADGRTCVQAGTSAARVHNNRDNNAQ